MPLPAAQQPRWPDSAVLSDVVAELAGFPPLVFAGECDGLKERLGAVARGEAFLLQGGDCAETFADSGADAIRNKVKTLLQMAVVLTYGARVPVVKIGRIAGQFAKPRSADTETRDGVTLPAYRGDAVNGQAFDLASRTPDPRRLLRVYNTSASTLNLVRAFTKGGFADLSQVHLWNQAFVASSPQGQRYEALASEIERALAFMAACGIDLAKERGLHEVDVYTSHEGLLLDYEEGLTRKDSLTGDWYDCSAHLLWIGERTRQLDGAHVEFFSGVHNPIGVKLGPNATPAEAVELAEQLNPLRVPGRLTYYARMGADHVRELLPPLLRAVKEEGHPVLWASDPMHGNGIVTADGVKTRRFDTIMAELEGFFQACWEVGVWPGGVHLEFTGEDVTECLGGADDVLEEHLASRYETLLDPRLNARQSLDLAFRLAELMRAPR